MNIYLLGTGSAVATSERDNSSIFFKSNDFNILIDCSGSTVHKISKLGLDFKDIQNVLITHFHPDHVYGLPSLIHSLAPYDKFPVIYAPDNLINNIYELMKVFGFENNVTILSVKKLIQQYNFIDIFPTRHTEDSIGVILDYEGKKTVYTSDTGPINNLHHKISGCNYLIHDCYAP
ncbi:MAG: MBL fold metallo-hydrolase, partial [Elusimicrobiota bacterium]